MSKRAPIRRPGLAAASALGAIRAVAGLLVGCGLVLLVGCGSSDAPRPRPVDVSTIPPSEAPFVVDPFTGYPLAVDPARKADVRAAFEALRTGATTAEVSARASGLIDADRRFQPAQVLMAQIDLLEGRDADAILRLDPIVDALPDYVAAALLRARALERSADPVGAYDAYLALAATQSLAVAKASELRQVAIDIGHQRFDEALTRLRFDDAQTWFDLLSGWDEAEAAARRAHWDRAPSVAPEVTEDPAVDSPVDLRRRADASTDAAPWTPDPERMATWSERTLDAASRLYRATGRAAAERVVLGRLLIDAPTPERRLRAAVLEVDHGNLRTAVDALEAIDSATLIDPSDRTARDEAIDRARFLRRLQMVPPRIQEKARQTEIDRADLAALLFWVFPNVRYAPLDNPPIATDILDHPDRQEILKVAAEGLMDVDETVHRFDPDRPASRRDVLSAVLVLLTSAEPLPACMDGVAIGTRLPRSAPWVCDQAARCGLVDDVAECLPEAPVTGRDALLVVRRGLAWMQSPSP